MARLDTSGLDAVMRDMARMGAQADALTTAMLQAGAEEIKGAWKEAAEAHGHVNTGDMIDSIGFAHEPVSLGAARAIEIWPRGKDRTGTRNAEKAYVLHYGTSRIKGSRWVDEAEYAGEQRANAAMQAVADQFAATGKVPEVQLSPDRAAGQRGTHKTIN